MDGGDEGEDRGAISRVALRFALGCGSLARDRLRADLRSWEAIARQAIARREAPAEVVPCDATRWHRLVGLCLRAPRHAAVARARGRAARAELARRAAPLWRPLERSAIARRVASHARTLRAAWRDELALAEQEGMEEDARGRALARVGLRSVTDRVLGRLATDPDVQALVATQSASVTSTALDELRAAAADADARLGDALQRWLDDPRGQLAALRRRMAPGAPA